MNFDDFNKEINDMAPNLSAAMRTIAVKVGNAAANDFTSHFDEQGINGKGWAEVQRRKPGTQAYKYPKNKKLSRRTRPILIGPNAMLKKAVQNSYKGFTQNSDSVTIRMKVDSDHGIYIQEGTEKMKARPFIGETPRLSNRILGIIEENLHLDSK